MTDLTDPRLIPSFVEQSARQRAQSLLDPGSMRELLGPFDRMTSPWLEQQGVVPQFDDGVVVARGTLNTQPVVIAAIEGSFQGGSLGEVAGAKIAGILELALEACRLGTPTAAILMLESGGVRLQEANLGLAAIAEIQSAIVALRQYQPVIGLIAGPVGCFGGMSITAGLCSYLLMTREGRLGLNGPLVIEQEAGIDEYDSRNRPFIWGLSGGEQRYATGLVDACINPNVNQVRAAILDYLQRGVPKQFRSDAIAPALATLGMVDTKDQIDPARAREILTQEQPS